MLLSLLLVVVSVARAYNVGDVITYDGIGYKITKLSTSNHGVVTPGTVEVSGKVTKTGNVVIPQTIRDNYATEYKVTGVGLFAFQKATGVVSVTLPEGIVSINNSAFAECPDLTRFNIPASVTVLGINLIAGSPKVENITVASGNAKWADIDGVLCDNTKTKLLLYPQGRTASSYIVPASIKTLEESAFITCKNLISIDLGTATTLNGIVFNTCDNLASLTFPKEMTSIPTEKGFYVKCNNLASFSVKDGNTRYSATDGILFDKNKTELIACPQGKVMSSGYSIPSTVTKISAKAFYNTNLTTITIPAHVKEIGDYAFEKARLRTITISEGVTTIRARAFTNTKLQTVTIPASAVNINVDENIFLGCAELTDITVASGNTNFESHDGVMFKKGKKELYAFPCGQKINEEYTIPSEVETIGRYAFCAVRKTGVQHIPTTVKVLSDGCFESSAYSKIVFDSPSQVTHIKSSAFRNMSNITELTIPASVTSLGKEAVYKCEKLQTVTFDSNSQLTEMHYGAFKKCPSLTTVNIKANSPIVFGANAFEGCTELTTVNAENGSLKSIGENAFLNCTKLANMNISNSVLETIETRAFQNCTSLTNVSMPASLQTIKESAFTECDQLATVTFPSNSQLKSIGRNAFQNSAIATIQLPNSLKTLGVEAFHSCKQLTSIDIPAGTTNVASQAFTSCTKLTSINVDNSNPNYASLDGMLMNKDKSRLMTFPPGKANSRYTRLPSFITAIDSAFYSCAEVTNVTIPRTVTEIGDFAFSNTKNLKSISFLGDIPSLAAKTFHNTDVTKITLFVRKSWFEDANNATTITSMKSKGFKDVHPSFIAQAPDLDRGIEYFPTSINTVGVIAFDTPRSSVIIPEKVKEQYKGNTNTYEVATVLDYAFENNQTTETIVFLGDIEEIGLNAFSKKNPSSPSSAIKNLYFVDNTVPTLASESFEVPSYYPFTDGQHIYVKRSKVNDYENKWKVGAHTLDITHKIPLQTYSYGATRCYPFDVQYDNNGDVRPYLPLDFTHINAADPIVRARRIDDGYVPANLGVLLHSISTASATSYCEMTEAQNHQQVNDPSGMYSNTSYKMVGVVEDTQVMSDASNNLYAFSKGMGKFLKIKTAPGNKMPYFSAYMKLDANNQAKAFSFRFDNDDYITGIDNITEADKNKDSAPYYNIDGIQVNNPTKGLYIHNGKKIIIK